MPSTERLGIDPEWQARNAYGSAVELWHASITVRVGSSIVVVAGRNAQCPIEPPDGVRSIRL